MEIVHAEIKSVKGEWRSIAQHDWVKNWNFTQDEYYESVLAQAMAQIAEKNGLGINDLPHLFPAVLRMLKSEIPWAK